jgi:DNA invertase Pin-like site-specific DNA recombinase
MANGKFVAYYRVSTKGQGSSGLGLEAQEAAVMQYLNGGAWELLAAFTDVESGTRKGNNRPELKRALQFCKKTGATLVIAKLDRLARNVHFVSGLMEAKVDFVAVDMPEANRLTIHIMAAMAEHEAEAISKRTKEALAAAKARGKVLGNPYNMTPEAQAKGAKGNREKAMSAYAPLAANVVNLKSRGMSFRAIAQHLNERGETTSTGSAFTAMTIKRIYDRATAQSC